MCRRCPKGLIHLRHQTSATDEEQNKTPKDRLKICRDKVVDKALAERYPVDFLNETFAGLVRGIRAKTDGPSRVVYWAVSSLIE